MPNCTIPFVSGVIETNIPFVSSVVETPARCISTALDANGGFSCR